MASADGLRGRVRRPDGAAFCVGFSLPLLGLSLGHVGRMGVQPVLLAAVAYLGLALQAGRLHLPGAPWAWAAAFCLSSGVAVFGPLAPADAPAYFAAAAATLLLYTAAFASIAVSPSGRRACLRGLVACAALSAAVGLLQVAASLVTGTALSLADNAGFTLSVQPYRASGFAPEASLLVPHLTLALLVLLSRRLAADLGVSSRMRIALLGLLAAGLLATRSSSLIWIAPALLAYGAGLWLRGDLGRGEAAGLLAAFVAAGVVFGFTYAARLDAADAGASAAIRAAKIQAALGVFARRPWLGAGLGAASDPQVIRPNLPGWFADAAPEPALHAGVDSWAVRIALEQGLAGLCLYALPLAVAVKGAVSRDPRRGATAGSLLVTSLAFWLAVGYRDVPLGILTVVWPLCLGPRAPAARPVRTLAGGAPALVHPAA